MQVGIDGHHGRQGRDDREQKASRHGVAHALANDEGDVEQAVAEDRVGEREGHDEQQQRGEGDGRRGEDGRLRTVPEREGDEPSPDRSRAAAERHDGQPPPLGRVGAAVPDERHNRGRAQVAHRHAESPAEPLVREPVLARSIHDAQLEPGLADTHRQGGNPDRNPRHRGMQHAPWKAEEERQQQPRQQDRAEERQPQHDAGQPRQRAPDVEQPVGEIEAEHAEGGEQPAADPGAEIAGSCEDDEQAEAERHELHQPAHQQIGSLTAQPVVPTFRSHHPRDAPHGATTQQIDRDRSVEAHVGLDRFPLELRPEGMPGGREDRVALANPGPVGRRARHHGLHEQARHPGRRLDVQSLGLGPPDVAVDEEKEDTPGRTRRREPPTTASRHVASARPCPGPAPLAPAAWRHRSMGRPRRPAGAVPGGGIPWSFSAICRACHSIPRMSSSIIR